MSHKQLWKKAGPFWGEEVQRECGGRPTKTAVTQPATPKRGGLRGKGGGQFRGRWHSIQQRYEKGE